MIEIRRLIGKCVICCVTCWWILFTSIVTMRSIYTWFEYGWEESLTTRNCEMSSYFTVWSHSSKPILILMWWNWLKCDSSGNLMISVFSISFLCLRLLLLLIITFDSVSWWMIMWGPLEMLMSRWRMSSLSLLLSCTIPSLSMWCFSLNSSIDTSPHLVSWSVHWKSGSILSSPSNWETLVVWTVWDLMERCIWEHVLFISFESSIISYWDLIVSFLEIS